MPRIKDFKMSWLEKIPGIGGLVDSAVGLFDYATGTSTKRQYKYQKELMKMQQSWQEKMSNTAVQRRVADMEKAGINPIMAVNGGGAAEMGSGGGGQIGMQSAPQTNILEALTTAQSLKKMQAETENIEADTENKKLDTIWTPELYQATIAMNNATTAKEKKEAELRAQEILKTQTEIALKQIEQNMRGMDLAKRKMYWETETKILEEQLGKQLKDANWDNNQFTEFFDWLGRRVQTISPFVSSINKGGGNTYNFTQSAPTVNY